MNILHYVLRKWDIKNCIYKIDELETRFHLYLNYVCALFYNIKLFACVISFIAHYNYYYSIIIIQ